MRKSTIAKHSACGPGSVFALAVGARLRDMRRELGLTQRQVAGPLSAGFVSAVEKGRIVPSLPSLALLAGRLGRTPAELLTGVNMEWPSGYTAPHDDGQAPPDSR